MNEVLVLLGGNLGDRKKNLLTAEKFIAEQIGKVELRSSVYETEAWGMNEQPAFLNKVILVRTDKNASQFLERILSIENKMGRMRNSKWEERIIDIDVLFFNREIINEDDLIVPHPFISERRFTLVPLNEIASGFVHPIYGRTINELLLNCADQLEVKKLE